MWINNDRAPILLLCICDFVHVRYVKCPLGLRPLKPFWKNTRCNRGRHLSTIAWTIGKRVYWEVRQTILKLKHLLQQRLSALPVTPGRKTSHSVCNWTICINLRIKLSLLVFWGGMLLLNVSPKDHVDPGACTFDLSLRQGKRFAKPSLWLFMWA